MKEAVLRSALSSLVALSLLPLPSWAREGPEGESPGPAPPEVVERMLELAELKQADVLCDLALDEGRIAVAAARKYRVRAFGVVGDPRRLPRIQEEVSAQGMGDLVKVMGREDRELDLGRATVIALDAAPGADPLALLKLENLKPGTRIVSHHLVVEGLAPSRTLKVAGRDGKEHRLYLWTITRRPDVVFVPTPQPVVEKMLELAGVKEGDVVYDLGCGDGRIMVTAAKRYGVKARGFDIDPRRVRESQENIRRHGVEGLAEARQADLFEIDLDEATVITLYLLPSLNAKLRPRLAKLRPGTRIVSHSFPMKGARPEQVVETAGGTHRIYLWTVPFEEE
jgi:predicted RNA methylase